MDQLTQHLLEASDRMLDASMKPLIRNWSDPPRAIQILEVLDRCIFAALASSFIITVLQIMYDQACKAEGVEHQQLVEQAVWRKEFDA